MTDWSLLGSGDAVARLARGLAAFDQRLATGDRVISRGGLTKACPLEVGGRLVGAFSVEGPPSVVVTVERR